MIEIVTKTTMKIEKEIEKEESISIIQTNMNDTIIKINHLK